VRKRTYRRFGAHEVTKGKWKGGLHVATSAYTAFLGQLVYLETYLNSRLLPQDPEEIHATTIMLNLQNLLEYELELVIADYISANKTEKNKSFLEKINSGFVSFKTKFESALAKKLITKNERDVMEQIRSIRNEQIHARPKTKRVKYKYFDKQLLTRAVMVHLFTDVNNLVLRLRSVSGNKEKWPVIPPGYAEEMGWYGNKPSKASAV
jgi:hypothetical protein